jgi:hypothetical protein
MKSITFRPLRFNKKMGKIVVASYMGWRKLIIADWNEFNLIVADDYKQMPSDEFVYSHQGELLYFMDYDPWEVPIFDHIPGQLMIDAIHQYYKHYGIRWNAAGCPNHVNYKMEGTDCEGVPCFAHYPADRLASDEGYNLNDYNPLTVGTVTKWLGWYLYQLENSRLQIGK